MADITFRCTQHRLYENYTCVEYVLLHELVEFKLTELKPTECIVRAELKRRECNAMGHAFVCIRRPFEF